MKKIFNFTSLLALCMALMLPALTSCDNDDFDTQQYKGGVNLNVWGPRPVARGGELRFLGSGMDQITSITLPGSGEFASLCLRMLSRDLLCFITQRVRSSLSQSLHSLSLSRSTK